MLIAVFLMIAVVYVYSTFFMKPAPRPRPAAPPTPTAQSSTPPPAPAGTPAVQAPPAAPRQPAAAAVVGEPAERTITVETRVVRAQFSNRGGELISWRLKQYLNDRKQPLEMIPQNLPGGPARPFTLRTEDGEVDARLDEALFEASEGSPTIDATKASAHLTFQFQDASGLHARKDFVLEPNSYVVQFDSSVSLGDRVFNPFMVWGPGLGDAAASAETSRYLQKPEAIFYQQSVQRVAVTQLTPDKCQGVPSENGCAWDAGFRFAGVDDHYFVSAVLPKGQLRIEYHPVQVLVQVPPSRGFWDSLLGRGAAPAAPQTATVELVSYAAKVGHATPGMRVFVGPKDFDVLAAADPQMVRVINFGMFVWLAVPLLRALKSINAYVGNYGWAIVILTILINAAMFPLRHKSMVSMRKMQAIQPQIKAIQDRYAKLKMNDPARGKMNTEMMALYLEKGVNPASGCVPMLLTIPVLFAFYSLLSQAIEIRGEPFGLWIRDLSLHDTLYVTPILMGITMVWQQKITPSSADPMQQKMMMAMPLVFTFMFLWAPSGLVLYWFVSNIMAIGQQYVTNRIVGPPKAALAHPPAERRLKTAGAGQGGGAAKRGGA